jgi:hypothetical protein
MNEELERLLDIIDDDCVRRDVPEDQTQELLERVRRESTENSAKLAFYKGLYCHE